MTPDRPVGDIHNSLLGPGPATLETALADSPNGKVMLLTIRTASTTLTVFLSGREARAWGERIIADAAQMPGGALVVAPAGAIGLGIPLS
jgi:hypothetical protein